jgi:hypothetical protein
MVKNRGRASLSGEDGVVQMKNFIFGSVFRK